MVIKRPFIVVFVLIDDVCNEIIQFSITVDSEKAWFYFVKKNLKDLFPNICDRTIFNRTKWNLYLVIKEIQKYLSRLPKFENDSIRIIDSMLIPVCKFTRAYFSKCFNDISSYGYCSSKKETYFCLKLHALVTVDGFISDFS